MLYELTRVDLHEYEPETTLFCLFAIQKLSTYMQCTTFEERLKVLLVYENYFDKLAKSDNRQLSKAAEEILDSIIKNSEKEASTAD